MTREEAYRELLNEPCPCLYDMNELLFDGPEIDWCITERIARRQAEADLADARREVERLEKQRLLDYDYSTELIAQAREKALEEVLAMFKDMTKRYKTPEDALWQIEQRIEALKQREDEDYRDAIRRREGI